MLSAIKSSILTVLCLATIVAQLAAAWDIQYTPASKSIGHLVGAIEDATVISQHITAALSVVSQETDLQAIEPLAVNVTEISTLFRREIMLMAGSAPYSDQYAVVVVNALDKKTLQLLITKHDDMVNDLPQLAAPIKVALKDYRSVVQSFGTTLHAVIVTRRDAVNKDFRALDVNISNALAAYSESG